MSKVGQKPIIVPATVTLDIAGKEITIKGKEGEMKINYPQSLDLKKDGDKLLVERKSENREVRALHGLFRSLIANAVIGVEKPWEKRLEVVGTGFNTKMQGEELVLKVGYSHPVIFKKQPRVKYAVVGNNKIIVTGADKQLVGQIAYEIKKIKKPDVYKGKGIRYEGEHLRIKPGKKAKTATA